MSNYRDALDYIYSFTNFEVTPAGDYTSKTFDLARMERLLAALENPHKRFKSIHVAGTKGKGSTAAMIENVLRAAGYKTGLYTSPSLHTFRERIRVGGGLISREDVIAGVEKLRPLASEIPGLTTFEIMTALAFDFFRAEEVELAVLEVGLGGRLDATNVVTPLVSIITSISFDHTAILGDTLPLIAREKAGIIKPNVPVVTFPQPEEALEVIRQIAAEKNAPLVQVASTLDFEIADVDYRATELGMDSGGQQLLLTRRTEAFVMTISEIELEVNLLGKHQLANAATALAALLVLGDQGIRVSEAAIRTGLATVSWPGRFEILSQNPTLVVDGAHNADSAHQLVETLYNVFPGARRHLIFGASKDKDIAGMLAELCPGVQSLILTRSRNPRAADPDQLAGMAYKFGIAAQIAPDVSTAIHLALQSALAGDVVCVTGSLFVVADAREGWLEEQGISVEKD